MNDGQLIADASWNVHAPWALSHGDEPSTPPRWFINASVAAHPARRPSVDVGLGGIVPIVRSDGDHGRRGERQGHVDPAEMPTTLPRSATWCTVGLRADTQERLGR